MAEFAPSRSRTTARDTGKQQHSSAQLTSQAALEDQHVLGNRVVQRLLAEHAAQAKLSVSMPDDRFEKEADRVAEQVLREEDRDADITTEPRVSRIQRAADAAVEAARIEPDEEEERKRREALMDAIEKQTSTEAAAAEEEALREEEEEEEIQTKRAPGSVPRVAGGLEASLNRRRGLGQPLPASERQFFEPRLRRDLRHVRIHTDAQAARDARSLDALAFTRGSDIYFGAGRYQPHTESGRRLLTHELTHTIQQTPGHAIPASSSETAAQPAAAALTHIGPTMLQRANGQEPATGEIVGSGGPHVDLQSSPWKIHAGTLRVPQFKAHGHRGAAYTRFANSHQLYRRRGYQRGEPGQVTVWENSVNPSGGANRLRQDLGFREGGTYIIEPVSSRRQERYRRVGPPSVAAQGLVRPYWRRGRAGVLQHDVDHMVELQVGGWNRNQAANSIDNMEMLENPANTASGRQVRGAVVDAIKAFLNDPDKGSQLPERFQPQRANATDEDAERIKANFDVVFNGIQGAGGPAPDAVSYYTREEVAQGEHIPHLMHSVSPGGGAVRILDLANPAGDRSVFSRHRYQEENVIGSAEKFVVYSYRYGGRAYRFNWPDGARQTERAAEGREQRQIRGLRIQHIAFTPDDPRHVGRLHANIFYGQKSQGGQFIRQQTDELYSWPIRRYFDRPGPVYAGYLEVGPLLGWIRDQYGSPLFSPIGFTSAFVAEDEGLTAVGTIRSTLPILRDVAIDLVLAGDDLRLQKQFTADEFQLPGPIQVDEASLLLSAGLESGLTMDGRVGFSIERVGEGYLEGAAGTTRGLRLAGGFSLDTRLFDPAEIAVTYENQVFSAEGRIGIPEGKVRGIQSANLTASYREGRLSADGEVRPDIPGIERGTLTMSYSEEEGLAMGGSLNLSGDVPGIRSGSVEVDLQQAAGEEGYRVSARGEAVPDIPGVDARLTVAYEDGAFTIGGQASYERGMLSGRVDVGATNRALDPEGRPTGEPTDQLRAYGGGTVTIRVAPWLQGTIGLRLLPNGELEVSGEVGLPAALDLFDERSYERNIFSIGIDIPIVGVAVAGQRIGIFATVRGGLDLSAGVGPGQLRELSLGVIYNPDRELDTRVSGRAEMFIPAHAGLRLFIRGGIGVGIPIVSATANLEIGGQLGLEGAVRAAVEVDWTPRQGLALDAEGEIFVEPRLTFDITGMVLVEADLLLTTIELYSKRWNLAQFEFGSGLRFGILFPIHYREGEPFEVSWSDVEFQVPDMDPDRILPDLIERIV